MDETTVSRTMISNDKNDDDHDEQFKTTPGEIFNLPNSLTESSLAPLVIFDEHGEILFPAETQSVSSKLNPIPRQNKIIHYCGYFCFWRRCEKDFHHVFIHFLFSQLGLFVLVSIYIAFGGLIFYVIESKYETRKNEQIKIKHLRGIHNIRLIATDEFNWMLNASFELRYALWRGMLSRLDGRDDTGWRVQVHSERFDRLIEDELARMQAEEEKLSDKHDTRVDAIYNQKWTYSTAMLYSATVITTVGYGNIAPKSILGKMMTCLYAMIGIPIMIMCLTNTGDLLAFLFIKYYSLLINFIQWIRRRRRRQRQQTKWSLETENGTAQHVPIAAAIGVLALYIVAGAVLFSHWEGWSYVDGAYFSFITFTTIGLGDLVPGKGTLTENKNGKSILCALYLLFGLVLTAMCFKLMQDDLFAIKQRLFTRLGFDNLHYYYHYHYHYHFHGHQQTSHIRKNNM